MSTHEEAVAEWRAKMAAKRGQAYEAPSSGPTAATGATGATAATAEPPATAMQWCDAMAAMNSTSPHEMHTLAQAAFSPAPPGTHPGTFREIAESLASQVADMHRRGGYDHGGGGY
jgi:hypothetical protein